MPLKQSVSELQGEQQSVRTISGTPPSSLSRLLLRAFCDLLD